MSCAISQKQIRDATEADLPAIVEIYNASIPSRIATADLEPVSVESRKRWFDEHSPTSRPLWVMENDNNTIMGWLSFQSFYGRPAYHKTAEVSLYISVPHRRQGIGKQLLQQAIQKSPELGLDTLVGFIFAHNRPSLQLFAKYHFQQWGYLPKVAELDGIKRGLVIVGKKVG
ncbi:N-acetyltransferase [Hydrococcus rivularis NIES-593]|uniref:N-acetyltransferase n=1 Tax=Hydrococcus rivularis NIES-593 TaxID=1921803 RepID=A0A1U7HPS3_9CYAN|nr:GNAT family N-acetyltransferase [Hydrococcus rivularis]OKH25586.1 N-acetyltransferase [Hydrococcus rivularis NIES-593]